jgi:hypothetical protein
MFKHKARCRILIGAAALLTLAGVAAADPASGPVFSDTGPDAEAYGASKE